MVLHSTYTSFGQSASLGHHQGLHKPLNSVGTHGWQKKKWQKKKRKPLPNPNGTKAEPSKLRSVLLWASRRLQYWCFSFEQSTSLSSLCLMYSIIYALFFCLICWGEFLGKNWLLSRSFLLAAAIAVYFPAQKCTFQKIWLNYFSFSCASSVLGLTIQH